jgi:hypothetical protein
MVKKWIGGGRRLLRGAVTKGSGDDSAGQSWAVQAQPHGRRRGVLARRSSGNSLGPVGTSGWREKGRGERLTGGPGWHSAARRRQIRFEIEFQTNSNPFKL